MRLAYKILVGAADRIFSINLKGGEKTDLNTVKTGKDIF
jgi:hypothetical protein